jgi:hypothetical protein
MKNVTEYTAAPDADKFREVDAAELGEIINEIRCLEHTATTDWSRDGWETDIDASTRAAELMDAFAHRVFVAQDEDGYYFATEPTLWIAYTADSGESFVKELTGEGGGSEERGEFSRGTKEEVSAALYARCPEEVDDFYNHSEATGRSF